MKNEKLLFSRLVKANEICVKLIEVLPKEGKTPNEEALESSLLEVFDKINLVFDDIRKAKEEA